ncbi:hypothetical protein TNCV_4508151 [Trichonephila clavipes]|nr:hypothetical protein TNCV_4508151 [Trichonephila clavipes]
MQFCPFDTMQKSLRTIKRQGLLSVAYIHNFYGSDDTEKFKAYESADTLNPDASYYPGDERFYHSTLLLLHFTPISIVILEDYDTLTGEKFQHQERLVLDKRNLVGAFTHLKDDTNSNFALKWSASSTTQNLPKSGVP